jgi:DNA-binding PadR family transcriptional regulator
MSVRQGLLALLAEGATYGARLRSEFESRTGGTWPLNIGQVYTTLARLERDGLVEPVGGADDEGRITYRLTSRGRAEAEAWWRTPVARDETPRDELVIKLALAVTSPGVDVAQVVQTQRTATLKHLRDLTRLKASGAHEPQGADLAWQLVLENLLFSGEAEIRWLDHVESTLARHARMPLASPPPSPDVSDAAEPRTSERKGARA